MNKIKSVLWAITLLFSTATSAQITIENTLNPTELVNDILVGSGVTISNVEFNYSIPLAGAVQAQAGFFEASTTSFPISSGIILATGNVSVAVGPNDNGGATDNEGVAVDPNDADLAAIATTTINNEAILEFDFVPSGDSLEFKYIFASEEYHEFSTSSFNDVFGFFISGPGITGPYTDGAENIALIEGTTLPVSMNNLNNGSANTGPCTNCAFLVDNTGGTDIQYDAHTVIMFARAQVQCGETYHIKMAIGDAGDTSLDSGVFLEASSFSSNGINVEIASVLGEDALREGCDSARVSFIRPAESDTVAITVDYEIGGSATNGVDYPTVTTSVFFPIGIDTVEFWITPEDDGIVEGAEDIIISVEIINECGDTITSEAIIQIIDPQDYDIITTDITIDCPTDSVMVTFTAPDGIPEFDIDWSSGGTEMDEWVPGNIPGTTTYTINTVDLCGVPSTGTVDVTLTAATPATITFNEDLFQICPGEDVEIEATVNDPYDATAVTYNWTPSGETTADITATPGAEAWYYLTVFDGCSTIIDSTKIEIGGVDITSIVVEAATDCPGITGYTPGSISVTPNFTTWTYELIGYVPEQTNGNFPGLAGGIDYILRVTDAAGCLTDTIVPVGLGANEVTATFDLDSLRDVTCNGLSNGGAYVLDIDGGILPPFTVTWTNGAGVFDTDPSVAVGGSSEQDGLPGGDWVVTVLDQEGCAWSESFIINEPDELTMTLTTNQPSCFGFSDGSITVNTIGGNGDETYTITNADGDVLNVANSNTANTLITGTYSISVVDGKGCSVSQDFLLEQPGEMDATIAITDPLCYGFETGSANVDTVINYTGDYESISYFWAPNPVGEEGIGASTIYKLGEGEYTLTINDQNGCTKVFTYEITYPAELVFSELDYAPAYCRLFDYQSGNGQVFASASGGTGDSDYLWTDLSKSTSTSTSSTWGGRNPGEYKIVATDDNGCKIERIITVDSLNPIADFTITSDELNADYKGTAVVEATFTNTSLNFINPIEPDPKPIFFWNTDTLTSSDFLVEEFETEVDTVYGERGVSYFAYVCLEIFNTNGCSDKVCKEIEIFEPVTFTNINVFSPNGDGINDLFTFNNFSASISEFKCVIVNRWGVVVSELNAITDSWDGTDMNGDLVSDGVYFYTYTATTDNGNVLKGQNNITKVSVK